MKYSVIVPVYNAQTTLNRCLDSLLREERNDLEIIIVDDGSKDQSGIIADKYAEEKPCIKCIHQENTGVAGARNAGLKLAEGRYVLFVDSDDYVTDDCFQILDAAAEAFDADLTLFSSCIENGSDRKERILQDLCLSDIHKVRQKLSEIICSKQINAPWGKLYKNELIQKYSVTFTENAEIAEDRAFNVKYALHVRSLAFSSGTICCISTDNRNSLSRKKREDLDRQVQLTSADMQTAIAASDLKKSEKDVFLAALNFGTYRSIYNCSKSLHRDKVPFMKRMSVLNRQCRSINKQKLPYPSTFNCRLVTLPVRWHLLPLIDLAGWKLTK